jgi:hypothetical protein
MFPRWVVTEIPEDHLPSTLGGLTLKAALDKPFEDIMPPVLETEVLARGFEITAHTWRSASLGFGSLCH